MEKYLRDSIFHFFLFRFQDTGRQYFIFPTTLSSFFLLLFSQKSFWDRVLYTCSHASMQIKDFWGKNPYSWQTRVFSVTCAGLVKLFEMGGGMRVFKSFFPLNFPVFAPPPHYFNRRRNKLEIFISFRSSVLFCR